MAEDQLCAVCGEAVGGGNASTCNSCGLPFHLNQRNDQEGKDCGAVWIDEQHLALEFACQRCLDGAGAPQAPPRPRVRRPRTGPRRYRKRS